MAEDQYDQYGNPLEDDENREQQWVKDLRKKAREADRLQKENEKYKQADTIREAGLSLKPAQMRALLGAHEGEATPEAYRKTATELGFIQEQPEVDPAVRQGHEQVTQASQGAQAGGADSDDDEDYSKFNTPAELTAHLLKKNPNAIQY